MSVQRIEKIESIIIKDPGIRRRVWTLLDFVHTIPIVFTHILRFCIMIEKLHFGLKTQKKQVSNWIAKLKI